MKIISSYCIEIKHMNKIFRPTLRIYNDALTLCVKWSGIVAKVSECQKRTLCTYSTLLELNKIA